MTKELFCKDCNLSYKDQGFCDLVIEDWAWNKVVPENDVLCPVCLMRRLWKSGVRCYGTFTSGPIMTVDGPAMKAVLTAARLVKIQEKLDRMSNND